MPELVGDGEDAVWVMTKVDTFVEFEVSSALTRGRTVVDEVGRWEDVVRLPVEVEVEGLSVRVVDVKEGEMDAVDADSEGCTLVLVAVAVVPLVLLAGGPGLKMSEMMDSIGFCAAGVVVARSWRFTRARSTGGMNMVFLF